MYMFSVQKRDRLRHTWTSELGLYIKDTNLVNWFRDYRTFFMLILVEHKI